MNILGSFGVSGLGFRYFMRGNNDFFRVSMINWFLRHTRLFRMGFDRIMVWGFKS